MSFRTEQLAEGVTLYCGDCLEVLPTVGDFDAVVTDPPYGIGESNRNFASRSKLANADKYSRSDWDNQPISDEHIAAMRACSRWQIIFGGNYFRLDPTSCWLVWDKQNGANDFADCELAWTNLDKAVRRITWRWAGMLQQDMANKEDRQHPTQKPLEVMRWAVGHLPDKAVKILDPFMGSGTTGVAAVKLGRQFTGIEIDPGYFDIACRRITAALKEPDLFVATQSALKQTSMFDPEAA